MRLQGLLATVAVAAVLAIASATETLGSAERRLLSRLAASGCCAEWSTFRRRRAARRRDSPGGCAEASSSRALIQRYAAFLERFDRAHEVDRAEAGTLCARLRVFANNEERALELTQRDESAAEYSAAHSPFGDMSARDFAEKVLMRSQTQTPPSQQDNLALDASHATALDDTAAFNANAFDWAAEGAVSPVRDQGSLGTCYIFAAAGAVEGQLAIHHERRNVSVSVEHALECDATFDSDAHEADCGVFGGFARLVFAFWQRAGGFVPEAAFPYCAGALDKRTLLPGCFPCMARGYRRDECGAHDDLYCNASSTQGQAPAGSAGGAGGGVCGGARGRAFVRRNRAGSVAAFARVANSTSPTALGAELRRSGPLTALVDATALQFYRRGVASPWLCSETAANHEVLLVGFGPGFLKAKNSWGKAWGEVGFFRIRPGKCGIDRTVTAVTIAAPAGI